MTHNCGDTNTKIKDGDVLRHVVDLKTKTCMRCGQKFSLSDCAPRTGHPQDR